MKETAFVIISAAEFSRSTALCLQVYYRHRKAPGSPHSQAHLHWSPELSWVATLEDQASQRSHREAKSLGGSRELPR